MNAVRDRVYLLLKDNVHRKIAGSVRGYDDRYLVTADPGCIHLKAAEIKSSLFYDLTLRQMQKHGLFQLASCHRLHKITVKPAVRV